MFAVRKKVCTFKGPLCNCFKIVVLSDVMGQKTQTYAFKVNLKVTSAFANFYSLYQGHCVCSVATQKVPPLRMFFFFFFFLSTPEHGGDEIA